MMNNQTLKWVLAISLILNLFLLGGLSAGAYKLFWSNSAPLAAAGGKNALRFAADGLSFEQKRMFKKTLRQARKSAIPLLQTSSEMRADAIKQFAAPSFDKLAIQKALARVREADRAVRIHVEEAVINYAETLSVEDRQKFAKGLSEKGPLRSPPMLKVPPQENIGE